jgi:hypothetical protein
MASLGAARYHILTSRKKDGGYAVGLDTNIFIAYGIPSRSEVYISCFIFPTGGSFGKEILWRSAGVELGSLRWNAGQRYDIHIGTDATPEASGTTIVANESNGGAMKSYILRISSGAIQFWLEGALEINYAGGTAAFDEIQFGNQIYIDDIWINDTLGAYNNGYPGIVRASTQFPTGVGALTDWTSSTAGNKYGQIDEQPVDGSDYIYSETVGNEQQFTYPGPVIPSGSQVKAIGVYDLAYKISEGNISHGLQIGGFSDLSGVINLSTGYMTGSGRAHYSETNPQTGVEWLATANPDTYLKHET